MKRHTRIEGRANQTRFSFVGKECRVVGRYSVCESERTGRVEVKFVERHPPSSRESEEDMPRIDAHRERRPGGKPGCAYVVGGAFVPYDMLDAGVGTGLYETLARFARSKGCRLMSSDVRSVFSEAFWKKQERKGRAGCGDKYNGGTYYSVPLIDALNACRRGQLPEAACERIRALDAPYGGWKCGQWELNYPPPASLGRISGRRRRRRA